MSKLNFGGKALISSPGTICTPLVSKRTMYHLTAKCIRVDDMIINFNDQLGFPSNAIGNMLIDLCTAMSFFHHDFYSSLEPAVAHCVTTERIPSPVEDFASLL